MTVAQLATSDKKIFNDLMTLFFNAEMVLKRRIAWAISHCFDVQPGWLEPYISKLVDELFLTGNHAGIDRNLSRIFSQFESEGFLWEELLIDKSFKMLESKNCSLACKCNAITIIYNLGKNHPELMKELKEILILREEVKHASIESRKKMILNKISK